jgi:uncharacterized NAD(P)/FAD-binding protein YdhS
VGSERFDMITPQPVSIAIIGMGPRGLTLLERMVENASMVALGVTITIRAYEPGVCGEGSHGSDQPDHLLVNTVSSQVTMVVPGSIAEKAGGLSFVQWARAEGYHRRGEHFVKAAGREITDFDYLPRRLLGEYLIAFHRLLLSCLPSYINFVHRRVAISDIDRSGDKFDLELADGSRETADFVFIATGHCKRRPNPNDDHFDDFVRRCHALNSRLAYFASPYPIASLASISADATVAVQGFGLTAHDIISELTAGRGGSYEPGVGGELRYLPSGKEPTIVLFSRNCLPFAARGVNQKGLTGRHKAEYFTPQAVARLRHQAAAKNGDRRLDFRKDVLPLIIKEMAYAHRKAQGKQGIDINTFEPTSEETRLINRLLWPLADHHFANYSEFVSFFDESIKADLAEASRGNLLSPIKAATEVLRDTREALRAAVEYGGLTPDSHRFFIEEFNAITNRVAFGPPKQRNHEFMALRAAGVIQIAGGPGSNCRIDESIASFQIETRFGDAIVRHRADALIIGRLDVFSPDTDNSALTRNLVKRGFIKPFVNDHYHPGGIDIDANLQPVMLDGSSLGNMWVIGYPAEGAHFYTHALPRTDIRSRQTDDAERCVLALLCTLRNAQPEKAARSTQFSQHEGYVDAAV